MACKSAVAVLLLAALPGTDARVGAGLHPALRKLNPFKALAMRLEQRPEERNCECINWQDAYFKKGVTCGQGHEMAHGNVDGAVQCRDFFERFDTNYCVNVGQSGVEDKQWCYVDSKCTNLKGGEHVSGAEVSWKHCTEKDPKTRELAMEELVVLSKSQDMSLSLLVKMAYPTLQMEPVPTAERWMFAQRAWGIHDGFPNATTAKFGLATAQFDNMNEIAKRKQSIVILNSDAGYPPYGVVRGRRAYEIRAASAHNRDAKHPSTFTEARCLAGCSPWGWDPKLERDDADLSKPRQNIDH